MVENKVIEFVYNGGSTPGQSRKVFVTEVDSVGFSGYDFSRNHVRRFLKAKTGRYSIDTTAKVVNVESLPSTVGPSTIERGLVADGFEVHNEYPYLVGVKVPAKPSLKVTATQFEFVGPNGRLVINNANGRLSVYENGNGINQNPNDPLPIFKALKRVLGE
jgi:hypothetical protein